MIRQYLRLPYRSRTVQTHLSSLLARNAYRESASEALLWSRNIRGSYSAPFHGGASSTLHMFLLIALATSAELSFRNDCDQAGNNLPVFRRSDVEKHKSKDTGIWVIRNNKVYDISEFVHSHPGGAGKIMMAAGGNLEPFWRLFAVHETKEVKEILNGLCIGTLHPDDVVIAKDVDDDDPYGKDPDRHPILIVNSSKPYNAEPPVDILVDSGFITPNEIHYKRNHLPVPIIDEKDYKLELSVENGRSVLLSLEDIMTKFERHSVVSTIQCAGNRRDEMMRSRAVKGLRWGAGAISTAEWTGVKLRDVLKYAGLDMEDPAFSNLQHVQFEGLDSDMTKGYGGSIPLYKAMDPNGDVLLAYEMNGDSLPYDHGYPLRVVVPGVVGARSVKWIGKIVASSQESQNHWQQNDYKGFSPNVDWDSVDFSTAPAIQELPVVSAICSPLDGSIVSKLDETVTVRGYAWSGGGRGIVRVDVTADGGDTWHTATLFPPPNQPSHKAWAWTLWEAEIPISDEKSMRLMCKATDYAYNTQPERVEPIWNLRGVLTNCWHKIDLNVEEE